VTLSVERTDVDFADRLEMGTADVAFVPDPLVAGALRRFALPPEPFVVLLRKGHPAARGKLDLERFLSLGHVLVAPRGAPGGIVESLLEKKGKKRTVVARVQHFVSAPAIVATTDLVVTCPQSVADYATQWLPIVARKPPLEIPIDRASMVWHERAQEDAAHAWLRATIEHIVRGRR
jgi:DNA-binding transcriptional LysR family regulator